MGPAIRKPAWVVGVCTLLVLWYPLPARAQIGSSFNAVPQCSVGFAAVSSTRAAAPSDAQHDPQTGAIFQFYRARDGAVRMTTTAGELQVEKKIYGDGRVQLVLRAGEDRLSVTVGRETVLTERGDRQLEVVLAQATENDWLHVAAMLAGSKALRLFRTLAANLDPTTAETPAGIAIVVSDAFVGMLNGDVDAVARLHRRYHGASQGRLRPVRLSLGRVNKCYETYLENVMLADTHYWQCSDYYAWYDPRQEICGSFWVLEVESAWFQFIACSAIPLKLE